MDDVFDIARKKLAEFAASDQYYPWLLGCVNKAISSLGDGEINVYISETDSAYQPRLEADCGKPVNYMNAEESQSGGVRVVNNTKRTVYSDNFNIRLEAQKNEFIKISGMAVINTL